VAVVGFTVVTVVTSSHALSTRLLITTSEELSNTTTTLETGLSSVTANVVGSPGLEIT